MAQTSSKSVGEDNPSHDAGDKVTLLQRLQRIVLRVPLWVLCVLIGGVALGFNLYRLGNPSIWFDEAFSVELARQPLPLLWHIIFGLEPNMELYYLFLHGWLGLTGLLGLPPTEFVVRFPSAIFAALSAVVVFLMGRRFLGITGGIIGAVLYLLNDLQLVYAQQTRSYSMQILLICVAWYALFAALSGEAHQKRWWVCYVVATMLAVYAHLFSLIIVLTQLLAFGGLLFLPGPWREKARRQVPGLLVSLVAIAVLIVPMLLVSLEGSRTGWLTIPHLRDIYLLFLTISGDSKIYLLVIAASCALALGVVTLVYLPWRTSVLGRITLDSSADDKRALQLRQHLPVAFALMCWLVVPIVLTYLISQGSMRFFSSRYLVTIVPPLFLLVGLGVAVIRLPMVKVVLALSLLLLALSSVPTYYKSAQVEDWNSTSFWLEQHYQAGDGLVCYDNAVQQGCQISVEYYLHAYPSAAHFTDDSPGAFSWTNFGPVNPAAGYEAAVDPTALAAYAAKHPRIFFIIGRLPNNLAAARAQAAQRWLDSHYHLIAQIVKPTVTIRLYVTTSTK